MSVLQMSCPRHSVPQSRTLQKTLTSLYVSIHLHYLTYVLHLVNILKQVIARHLLLDGLMEGWLTCDFNMYFYHITTMVIVKG